MKIRTKITATYVILAGLLVASLGAFLSTGMESYFKQRLIDELNRQADLVLYILRNDTTGSLRQVDNQVRQIGGFENVRITLVDDLGNVLADSDVPLTELPNVQNHLERPEIRQALRSGIGYDIRRSATVGHDFLYVAKMVATFPPKSIFHSMKYLRLSKPLEAVQEQANYIRATIILIGLGTLVLIVLVSIAISRFITKPMMQIARGVEQIRSGDLNARIPVSSNDEIGLAAKAINELVDKLKDDIVQLKKLELVRSQFLGNVSHELRTPIFAVQGYLETLLSGAIDDPTVNRSFIEKAQSNLNRLHSLLEDLINISQIESGEMKMSFRFFRLNEFLESIIKDFEDLARARQVAVKLSLKTTSTDEAFGDRERLRQAMNNLISNAINYNIAGGEVDLSSEHDTQGFRICLRDTGVGISPEHLPRIFERFYRVDSDRSRALGGTGLGLAIVKHIIEAHGSRVMVESTVGKGSAFCFFLKSSA
jgi:two-component system phosphate regulon sensor histidine kinase PhoR